MSLSSEPGSQADSSTSPSLLARARELDREAWQRLSELYGPVVYRWARQAGLQPHDAADVLQNVFHALARNIGSYRQRSSGDSFRGWLWTVTRNKVRDHYRERRDRACAAGGTTAYQRLEQLPERPPEPDSECGSVEIRQMRRRALNLVKDHFERTTWQAFWRAVVVGESAADIADDLGVSVWAVYKAKSRVLQRLRAELEGLVE